MFSSLKLRSSRLMLCFAALLTVGAFATSSQAAPVTIDDFASNQNVAVSAPGFHPFLDHVGPSIIGGARDVLINIINNPGAPTQEVQVAEVLGAMSVATDTFVEADVTFVWDGIGGVGLDATGEQDLTDGGLNTQLGILLVSNDLPVDFMFTLRDTNGQVAMRTISVPAVVVPTQFIAKYSSFSNYGVFDFSSVRSVELLVTATGVSKTYDVVFDLIDSSAVPEPSSMILLSLGFGGLAILGYGRRRRRQDS